MSKQSNVNGLAKNLTTIFSLAAVEQNNTTNKSVQYHVQKFIDHLEWSINRKQDIKDDIFDKGVEMNANRGRQLTMPVSFCNGSVTGTGTTISRTLLKRCLHTSSKLRSICSLSKSTLPSRTQQPLRMQVPSLPSQPNTLTQPRSFGCGAFFMLGTTLPAPVARPYNCVATTTNTAILQVCSEEEK